MLGITSQSRRLSASFEDCPRDCELLLVEKVQYLQEDLLGDAGGGGAAREEIQSVVRLIPYSHCKPKRSGANRTAESTPFTLAQNAQQCAFHNSILFTLHTVECGSFHTGREAKRSEAHYSVLLWVALFCLKA